MNTDADREAEPGRPLERRYPLSAGIRAAVVASIAICTVLGYMIASAVGQIACSNTGCSARTPILWGILGAAVGLVGAAIVGVLLARSYGEWRMLRTTAAGPSTEVDLADEDAPPRGTC